MRAEFIISAVRPDQFPKEGLPEVAFLGRSNTGKSSLLNRLVGNDRLAFSSSRPGTTRVINFFRVDDKYLFVDLPGYGFARVSREKSHAWKDLIESYLLERQALALCLLLIDARRGWMEPDLELRRWLGLHGRPYQVVATKIDKLKTQSERNRGLAALCDGISERPPVPFSAVTGQGVKELWQTILKIQSGK